MGSRRERPWESCRYQSALIRSREVGTGATGLWGPWGWWHSPGSQVEGMGCEAVGVSLGHESLEDRTGPVLTALDLQCPAQAVAP